MKRNRQSSADWMHQQQKYEMAEAVATAEALAAAEAPPPLRFSPPTYMEGIEQEGIVPASCPRRPGPVMPLPLRDWSKVDFNTYQQYLPDILYCAPPPFLSCKHPWTIPVEDPDDEPAAARDRPLVESPPEVPASPLRTHSPKRRRTHSPIRPPAPSPVRLPALSSGSPEIVSAPPVGLVLTPMKTICLKHSSRFKKPSPSRSLILRMSNPHKPRSSRSPPVTRSVMPYPQNLPRSRPVSTPLNYPMPPAAHSPTALQTHSLKHHRTHSPKPLSTLLTVPPLVHSAMYSPKRPRTHSPIRPPASSPVRLPAFSSVPLPPTSILNIPMSPPLRTPKPGPMSPTALSLVTRAPGRHQSAYVDPWNPPHYMTIHRGMHGHTPERITQAPSQSSALNYLSVIQSTGQIRQIFGNNENASGAVNRKRKNEFF